MSPAGQARFPCRASKGLKSYEAWTQGPHRETFSGQGWNEISSFIHVHSKSWTCGIYLPLKKNVIWLYGSFPEMIRYRQFDLHPCRRCACVIDVPVGNRAWPSQNPCKSIDAPNDHERTCLTDGSGACYVVLSLMLSQLYIVIWIYNKLYTDHCYCYFVLMNITTITCYYYLFVYYNVVKTTIYIYIENIAISFVIVLHIVKPALYHWRAALRCPRCALNIFNCPSASFALPASRSGSLGGLLDDNLWYIIEK